MRTIDEYLNLPYTVELIPENDGTWFVAIKELPGCMSAGDTPEEAIQMIRDAQKAWMETAFDEGLAIPEPRREEEYSGNFRLRIPRNLHRKLAEAAEEEGVSLNTICVNFLSEAVGARIAKNGPEPMIRADWLEKIKQISENLEVYAAKHHA